MKRSILIFLIVISVSGIISCSSGPSFCECFGGSPLDKSASLIEKCQNKFKDISPTEITSRITRGECNQ